MRDAHSKLFYAQISSNHFPADGGTLVCFVFGELSSSRFPQLYFIACFARSKKESCKSSGKGSRCAVASLFCKFYGAFGKFYRVFQARPYSFDARPKLSNTRCRLRHGRRNSHGRRSLAGAGVVEGLSGSIS
jgi:hypothetical protein